MVYESYIERMLRIQNSNLADQDPFLKPNNTTRTYEEEQKKKDDDDLRWKQYREDSIRSGKNPGF